HVSGAWHALSGRATPALESAMRSRTHKAKQAVDSQARTPKVAGRGPASPPALWRHKWVLGLALVALAFGTTFSVFEFVLPGRIPPELVGEWRVVGGQMDGATFEFRRDGTMIGRLTADGKEGLIEGTAEVVGTKLRTTTTNPFTRKAETGTQT